MLLDQELVCNDVLLNSETEMYAWYPMNQEGVLQDSSNETKNSINRPELSSKSRGPPGKGNCIELSGKSLEDSGCHTSHHLLLLK